MTDGATDLLNLWEMPNDAYKALKELTPNHDLCQLYEAEWAQGNKQGPLTLARFADPKTSVIGFICKFTDAMWDAVMEARGGKPKEKLLPTTSTLMVEPAKPEHELPIDW
jgi:hypothetical protein